MKWSRFYRDALGLLADAGNPQPRSDARRMIEQAARGEGMWPALLDDFVTVRTAADFDQMLQRRLNGEPLQYVLGSWGFRTLDLAVDPRVMIPRPETEGIVGLALEELRRAQSREPQRQLRAVDLGTGSGCIGLSLVAEHSSVLVVCTDSSPDAVASARANTAGLGRPSSRVSIIAGSWFDPLPSELVGNLDLVVSNPPYVGGEEELPSEVLDWEPHEALFAGRDGFEAAVTLISGAPRWLRRGGALVLELGETQLERASQFAEDQGFSEVEIHKDLAGRDRALVARIGELRGMEGPK